MSLLAQLAGKLQIDYPKRIFQRWNARDLGAEKVLKQLEQTDDGIILIDFFEELMKEEGFCLSLNQRRDALSEKNIQLVLTIPFGGDFLQQFSRNLPDLWSVRNLVGELRMNVSSDSGGIFISDWGEAYESFGSSEEIESEIERLRGRANDLERLPTEKENLIQVYIRLGRLYNQISEYKFSEKVLKKAISIAESGKFETQIVWAKHELSNTFLYERNYKSSLKVLKESLFIAQQFEDTKGQADSLHRIGMIYQVKGDYELALKQYKASKKIREHIGDRQGLADSLHQIGIIYQYKGESDLALEQYQASQKLKEQIGDVKGLAYSLGQIGVIYQDRGDYDHALEQYQAAKKITEQIGDGRGQSYSLHQIGRIYQLKGDYDRALEYYQASKKLKEQTLDIKGIATSIHQIGRIYQYKGQYDLALIKFVNAWNLFSQIDASEANQAMRNIQQIREAMGEEAYQAVLNKIETENKN